MKKLDSRCLLICTILNIMLAVIYGSISVFCFSTVCLIIIEVLRRQMNKNEFFFGWQSEVIIWAVCLLALILVYYAECINYGLPYIMSDDYHTDYEWVEECISGGYYTIPQMKAGSAFFSLANCNAYILFLSYVRRIAEFLGGNHTLNSRIINMTAVICSAYLMAGYAGDRFHIGRKLKKRIVYLIALFPNILYLSAHVYRDSYMMFLLVLLFYIWNTWTEKHKVLLFAITAVDIYLLYYTRAFSVVYAICIIFFSFYFKKSDKLSITSKDSFRKTIGWISGLTVGTAFLYILLGSRKFSHYIEGYTAIASNYDIAGKLYGMPLLPFGWLMRTIYYLLSPCYPQIVGTAVFGNLLDAVFFIVTLGTCFLFFLYPYLLRGIMRLNNLALVFAVIFVSAAVVTSGVRHIMMAYPFMFTIYAIEYNKASAKRRKEYAVISSVSLVMFLSLYICLKGI